MKCWWWCCCCDRRKKEQQNASQLLDGVEHRGVVGLLGDLGHKLLVHDLVVAVEHQHGARVEAGERAVHDADTPRLAELAAAERRQRRDVGQLGRLAEARRRKRQVRRHVQHHDVLDYRGSAHRDVDELPALGLEESAERPGAQMHRKQTRSGHFGIGTVRPEHRI